MKDNYAKQMHEMGLKGVQKGAQIAPNKSPQAQTFLVLKKEQETDKTRRFLDDKKKLRTKGDGKVLRTRDECMQCKQ